MDTLFMNSGNSKTLNAHRLLLNLSDEINLKRSDKYVKYIYYTWKNLKKSYKKINLKYQLQHGMKSLNCLMDHIMCEIFKTILSISSKNMRQLLIILQ